MTTHSLGLSYIQRWTYGVVSPINGRAHHSLTFYSLGCSSFNLLPLSPSGLSSSLSFHFTIVSYISRKAIEARGVIYPIVIFCRQLTILLLYHRLFGVYRTIRYLIYSGIVFCALFYLTYTGTAIATPFLCSHPTDIARYSLCRDQVVLTITCGVVNVLTDFYLLALPIAPLMRLKLQHRKKLGLFAIFLTGLM